MVRFVQFVFDMCFAHLRATMRALFQDLNFQKWSETLNFFYTFDIFWLPNVLGQSADFLRGVAFWSIRSSGLLRWFCMTGAALRMTWHHFFVAGAILCKDTWTGTTTNYTTPHHTTFSSCGRGDHCIHSKKHNSDHLLVHQWIRSAIHASQQFTSPIVVYVETSATALCGTTGTNLLTFTRSCIQCKICSYREKLLTIHSEEFRSLSTRTVKYDQRTLSLYCLFHPPSREHRL